MKKLQYLGYSFEHARCFGLMLKKDFVEAVYKADIDHYHETRNWIKRRIGCVKPAEKLLVDKEPNKFFVFARDF